MKNKKKKDKRTLRYHHTDHHHQHDHPSVGSDTHAICGIHRQALRPKTKAKRKWRRRRRGWAPRPGGRGSYIMDTWRDGSRATSPGRPCGRGARRGADSPSTPARTGRGRPGNPRAARPAPSFAPGRSRTARASTGCGIDR